MRWEYIQVSLFSFKFLFFFLFCGSWIMMQSFEGVRWNEQQRYLSIRLVCLQYTQNTLSHTFWSFEFLSFFFLLYFGIHSSKLRCFMACLLECRKKIKRLKSWKKTTERMMRWEWERKFGNVGIVYYFAWRYFT